MIYKKVKKQEEEARPVVHKKDNNLKHTTAILWSDRITTLSAILPISKNYRSEAAPAVVG
jgi:hypothetical protein